jgi:transposase
MKGRIRYTEEFKKDAVSQVKDRGYTVSEVANRLGICTNSLYKWIHKYNKPVANRREEARQAEEIHRLKAELARVTEERDILKKATAYFAKETV